MNDVRVANWSELNEALYHESWQGPLGRFRSDFVFRGVADASNSTLATSLMRLGEGYQRLEGHLLRNFRKYAFMESNEAVPVDSVWNWLAKAQHHGLPTRMLDWSYSPFVALHFATARLDLMKEDGVVWAINFVEANKFLPRRLKRILSDEGSDTATVTMLAPWDPPHAFDRLARTPFVIFLEPPSLDPRIVNQFALFSLISSPAGMLNEWVARHPALAKQIVIPARLKWEIRDKLDQANINERVLFPGLDGLSQWLTRYYWPKPREKRSRSDGEDRD